MTPHPFDPSYTSPRCVVCGHPKDHPSHDLAAQRGQGAEATAHTTTRRRR